MTPKNRVAAITCLLASVATWGPGTANAATGWTNAGVITEITQQPSQYQWVFVQANVTGNTSGCTSATGFFFTVSDERQKRMFAMLLAAQSAGRQVKIYFNVTNTSTDCVWGAALMDGVIVVS